MLTFLLPAAPGSPGLPNAVQQLCTSVAWQPPLQPKGVIVGYEIRFSSNLSEIVRLDADVYSFITDHQQRSQDVLVQVKCAILIAALH